MLLLTSQGVGWSVEMCEFDSGPKAARMSQLVDRKQLPRLWHGHVALSAFPQDEVPASCFSPRDEGWIPQAAVCLR